MRLRDHLIAAAVALGVTVVSLSTGRAPQTAPSGPDGTDPVATPVDAAAIAD